MPIKKVHPLGARLLDVPAGTPDFIAQRVVIKSFRTSQFPQKNVDYFYKFVTTKDEVADLCGN